MTFRLSHLFLPVAAALALALAGCSSSRSTSYKGGRSPSVPQQIVVPGSLAAPSRQLLSQARGWLGTPYRYGGDGHDGVDCSGLMVNLYRDALGIKLPRNSAQQCDYCTPVGRDKAQAGDLFFFATGADASQVSHVGMYLGDGRLLHASGTRGVVVVDANSDYFVKHFLSAGRVEQYHAMIDKSGPVEEAKPSAPSYTPVASLPAPGKEKEAQPGVPSYTPVASLPAPRRDARPVAANPDDARRSVLDQLIEQKLDSIIAAQAFEP